MYVQLRSFGFYDIMIVPKATTSYQPHYSLNC